MKYTVHELQKELSNYPPAEVLGICMKLAKFKKENKNYLTYLLFGAANEDKYIEESKNLLSIAMDTISRKTTFTTKKGLQKVVRHLNKLIKNSTSKKTEVELRIYFCNQVRLHRFNLDASKIIHNLYCRELDKIKSAHSKLHEDLQYDYNNELEKLGITQ